MQRATEHPMPRYEPLQRRAFLVHDLMPAGECAALIRHTESVGYTDAPVTTARGPVMMQHVRNNARVMVDAPDAADSLWARLQPWMPDAWQEVERDGATWLAIGLNERFRFYRYAPGQRFRIHRDGAFRRDEDEVSMLTVLVYLNDGCEGGATSLFTGQEPREVPPTTGLALCFAHELLHEGTEVLAGRKYVLRSDVMYRRQSR